MGLGGTKDSLRPDFFSLPTKVNYNSANEGSKYGNVGVTDQILNLFGLKGENLL